MVALIKSFLLVVLGFALGALATLVFIKHTESGGILPAGGRNSANLPPSPPASPNSPNSPQPPAANTTLFGKPSDAPASPPPPAVVSTPEPRQPEPEPEPVTPAKEPATVVVTPPPAPEPEPEPAEPVVADTTPVDFGELCIKPAAWPPVIILNKAIDAQILQGNEVIGELPVAAGERLQVTKVFGDGTVEVRAKGARFIVDHKLTDLEPQARVRLAEISGKPRAPALPPPTPRAEPPPRTETTRGGKKEEPSREPTTGDDDLDRRLRSLFGTPSRR